MSWRMVRALCSLSLLAVLLLLPGCSRHQTAPPSAPTPTAASLAVSCDTTTLGAFGQQARCQARLTLSDASTQDQTATAQWSSSDPAKVAVSANGVISALAVGSADISAAASGLTGRQSVTVIVACTFSASPAALSFPHTGGSQHVTLAVAPDGCSPSAWTASTSTPGLTVSPASGSGSGTVTVTAAANGGPAQTGTATIAGQAVTANIAAQPRPPKHALHLTLTQGEQLSGPYAGIVTGPGGFSCSLTGNTATCPGVEYDEGTTVVLTVTLTVATFARPIQRTTGCDARTSSTCTVTMNGDRSLTISIGCDVSCGLEPLAAETRQWSSTVKNAGGVISRFTLPSAVMPKNEISAKLTVRSGSPAPLAAIRHRA